MNENELKIIVTIADLGGGGTEIQTLHLVRSLTRAGHQIEVVCFFVSYPQVVADFEKSGIKVTLLQSRSSDFGVGLFWQLYHLFRTRLPDVVHVQYMRHGFLALLAAAAARVRFRFATVHQTAESYGLIPRVLMRLAALVANQVFCVSLASERSWFGRVGTLAEEKIGKRRHATIYNAVETDRIIELSSVTDATRLRLAYNLSDGPIVAAVGRISLEKGTDVLLAAFQTLLASVPDAQLLVIGEDLQGFGLSERINSLGLGARVVVSGWLPAEEIFRLYGIVRVVAVPSRSEGFCLVAAEAMAAARPVVASRTGGLIEVVENGLTGLLVTPGNPVELAAGLTDLLLNPEKAESMGRQGRKRATELFSMEAYGNAVAAVYDRVLRHARN